MLKLIVITALLCTFSCTVNAQNNVTITKEHKLSEPFSTTLVDGSNLLRISSNRTHVIVNSTEENAKPCIVQVDRNEHPIQKKLKATKLGDKIIVWGVRAKYVVGRRSRMDYSVLIVDPKECSYKPVTTYEEETLWFDVNKNLPEIVVNDDSFDVYYSTMRTCTPCRYSKDGKRLDLKKGMETEPLQPTVSTYVRPFDAPGVKNGYFYAHNYDDRTSKVKLYDSDFNVVKEKKLKHRIDAAEVKNGADPTVTICHFSSIRENPLNTETVICQRLDTNLTPVFTTKLLLTVKHDPASVSLAINSAGDSYISVVESNEFEDVDQFSLHKMKADGQIPTPNIYKLGEMPRQRFYGNWKLRGLIVHDQYCFELTKDWPVFAYPDKADEHESIKCIDI